MFFSWFEKKKLLSFKTNSNKVANNDAYYSHTYRENYRKMWIDELKNYVP